LNTTDKSRNEAEAKGYFLKNENGNLAYNIKMFNFWLTDYREIEKIMFEHSKNISTKSFLL